MYAIRSYYADRAVVPEIELGLLVGVFQVLRRRRNHGALVDGAVFPDAGAVVDEHMGTQCRAFADGDVGIDGA